MFVVTHVRQVLQQAVAVGASSPYLAAASVTRPLQMLCIFGAYRAMRVRTAGPRYELIRYQ